MTIAQAYTNIGKRVHITIDVPDNKYGLHLYAGDTGIIDTGAGEIGFVPDRYVETYNLLKFAHEGVPFVEYCVLASGDEVAALPMFEGVA